MSSPILITSISEERSVDRLPDIDLHKLLAQAASKLPEKDMELDKLKDDLPMTWAMVATQAPIQKAAHTKADLELTAIQPTQTDMSNTRHILTSTATAQSFHERINQKATMERLATQNTISGVPSKPPASKFAHLIDRLSMSVQSLAHKTGLSEATLTTSQNKFASKWNDLLDNVSMSVQTFTENAVTSFQRYSKPQANDAPSVSPDRSPVSVRPQLISTQSLSNGIDSFTQGEPAVVQRTTQGQSNVAQPNAPAYTSTSTGAVENTALLNSPIFSSNATDSIKPVSATLAGQQGNASATQQNVPDLPSNSALLTANAAISDPSNNPNNLVQTTSTTLVAQSNNMPASQQGIETASAVAALEIPTGDPAVSSGANEVTNSSQAMSSTSDIKSMRSAIFTEQDADNNASIIAPLSFATQAQATSTVLPQPDDLPSASRQLRQQTQASHLGNNNLNQTNEVRVNLVTGQSVVITGSADQGFHLRPSDSHLKQILVQHAEDHPLSSGQLSLTIDPVDSATDHQRQPKQRPYPYEVDE